MTRLANASVLVTVPLAGKEFGGHATATMSVSVDIEWLGSLNEWQFTEDWESNPEGRLSRAAEDSIEYAKLAAGRWDYFNVQGFTPPSPQLFEKHLSEDNRADLGFGLALREQDGGSTLGFAFVRRTFANNLFIEYLAASPSCEGRVKGVGTALMLVIARLADRWDCGEVWGECTEVSTSYYSHLRRQIHALQRLPGQPGFFQDRFTFAVSDLLHLASSPAAPELLL